MSWPKMPKRKSHRVQHNKETTGKYFTILSKDSTQLSILPPVSLERKRVKHLGHLKRQARAKKFIQKKTAS